jgi:diguanylate cyclase (GGDEF)-like protein
MGALLGWMQPHDHRDARRTLRLLVLVAVATTVATAPVSASGVEETSAWLLLAAIGSVVLCVAIAAVNWVMTETWPVAWLACPVLAVSAITLAGLATSDASVGAQVFFIFCAVWGGALLSGPGAVIMAVLSIAGEAVLVFTQLPAWEALTDTIYLGAAIATLSYLLARASARTRRKVAGLNERASTDWLTGLVNRSAFEEALDQATRRDEALGTSLILVDVDRFKAINDEHGHPGGDQILVQLAQIVSAVARRDDVVCRLGGDELAVLMPGCSVATAQRRALDIVESVRSSLFLLPGTPPLRVSVSAGVAHHPSDAVEPQALYAVADAALYRAKRGGRDQVVQHSA